MNLSVSLYSCHPLIRDGKMDIYEVMSFFKECGVKYVELVDMYIRDEDELAKIKAFLDENGMQVSSYSASNEFVLGGEAERQKSIAHLKACCDVARYFSTDIVRVFAGNMDAEGTLSYDDCARKIVDGFRQCIKTAEEKGVYFCLENHGVLAGRPEQVKCIIDAVGSPNLKATADTGNFNIVGADPYEAVKLLIDDIGHVHFKDMVEVADGGWVSPQGKHFLGCDIGGGVVELERIVALLREHGYSGYISIEYEAPEEECCAAVKKSIDYTKRLIES